MSDWHSMQEFFSEIASAGFFKRLFSWKKIKAKADAAQSEWKELEAKQRELEEVKQKLTVEETENRSGKETSASLKQELDAKQQELNAKQQELNAKQQELNAKQRELEEVKQKLTVCWFARHQLKQKFCLIVITLKKIFGEIVRASCPEIALQACRVRKGLAGRFLI